MSKFLIIRFSSFGDIAQALFAAEALHKSHPHAEIHWLTRQDFSEFVESNPNITKVWALERRKGLRGLFSIVKELNREKFTHVYDAHNNLRSHVVSLSLKFFQPRIRFKKRSKNRIQRFFLFRLGINLFPQPFKGAVSYLTPLADWTGKEARVGAEINMETGTSSVLPPPLRLKFKTPLANLSHLSLSDLPLSKMIVLAPSATWELKRWPIEHWIQLIESNPQSQFVLLGGPQDEHCHEIAKAVSKTSTVVNLTGQLSWSESAQVLTHAQAIVAGDTGLLHVADLIGKPAIAIIGPTAFGYPSRETSKILEVDLKCKPCTKDGRGRCRNTVYKRCLVEVTPERVAHALRRLTS